MESYPSIETVFERNPEVKFKKIRPDVFSRREVEALWRIEWSVHEKIDGTNIRVIWDGERLEYRGRTDESMMPAHLLGVLEALWEPKVEHLKVRFYNGACFYGEGFGPKIGHAGGLYGAICQFAMFDIKIGKWWLEDDTIVEIAKELDVPLAPFMGTISPVNFETLCHVVKAKSAYGDFPVEGVVCRPAGVQLFDRNGERVIFKLKAKDLP